MADAAPKRFTRSKSDRKIAGVCGGVAKYFNIDPTLVRVVWGVLAFTGVGLLAYLIFWMVAPEE